MFVPEEIVLAANATLVGLCSGADFAMEAVEQYLPRNTCALIKSSFGFKLGKVCPYLEVSDMIVGENTCDGKKKAYETLKTLTPNVYVMDMPQTKSEEGRDLLAAEYWRFLGQVQELTGVDVTVKSLKNAIGLVNAKRKALHRLAALRMADPAPISGLDALLINQVAFYDNPARFTASVNTICDNLEKAIAEGRGVKPAKMPRIIISGCPMAVPNWKLPAIVEGAGAVIVGEESCVGERGQRNLVDDSGSSLEDLMDAIVDRYFDIDCAIFTPNPDRLEHIEEIYRKTGCPRCHSLRSAVLPAIHHGVDSGGEGFGGKRYPDTQDRNGLLDGRCWSVENTDRGFSGTFEVTGYAPSGFRFRKSGLQIACFRGADEFRYENHWN